MTSNTLRCNHLTPLPFKGLKKHVRRTWNSVDCSQWSQDANCANSGQAEVFRYDAVLERPAHTATTHIADTGTGNSKVLALAIRHRSSFYVIPALLNRRQPRLDLWATHSWPHTHTYTYQKQCDFR